MPHSSKIRFLLILMTTSRYLASLFLFFRYTQVENSEAYQQCGCCPYLGQKIIQHYANEHPHAENPFACVPEPRWVAISQPASDSTFWPASVKLRTEVGN